MAKGGGLGGRGRDRDEERREEEGWPEYPEEYLGAGAVPWHAREENAGDPHYPGLSGAVRIDEGPEWRSYSDGTKGFQRSNSDVSMIFSQDTQKIIYKPHGKAPRLAGSRRLRVRQVLDKGESMRMYSKSLLADVLKRLDLYGDRTIKAIASRAIDEYIEKSKENNRRVTRKEITMAVAAIIGYIVEFMGYAINKSRIIDAVLSSPRADGRLPRKQDAVRAELWKVKKRINEYGIRSWIQATLREEVSSRFKVPGAENARLCSVARRALNLVDTKVWEVAGGSRLEETVRKISSYIIVASVANGKSFQGKSAEAIAAASLYAAARMVNINVSQRSVASIFNINETNVRKAFKFLVEDQVIIVVPRLIERPTDPGVAPVGRRPIF